MAYLATDLNGSEKIFEEYPKAVKETWLPWDGLSFFIYLPKGTIKKIIGRDLTFDDEPVELEAD